LAAKKSRTTFSKVSRERELREKRELKREKKEAARIAKSLGLAARPDPESQSE
jgi:hypothetical protein